jgi:ribosomal protein S12 methylthiotransferase accessory factor
LAVSPDEVRDALLRGVVIYGSSSMGALRAVEVPGVIGIGRVYEMYRSGLIERDDEVAVLFDADTYRPLTVPLVNVRYAVTRLVNSATITPDAGADLVEAATRLHYTERTYRNILQASGLRDSSNVDDLVQLLTSFDLKRDDAYLLLETMAGLDPPLGTHRVAVPIKNRELAGPGHDRVLERESPDAEILVWEYGDRIALSDLIRFLKVTGHFEDIARRVLGRFAAADASLASVDCASTQAAPDEQQLLDWVRVTWGWETPEEAHVSMRDLGIGLDDALQSLSAESCMEQRLIDAATRPSDAFLRAIRADLWYSDLSLKREVLRLSSVTFFAERARALEPPTDAEFVDAKRCICRMRRTLSWRDVQHDLRQLGVSSAQLDDSVRDLALARRAAQPLLSKLGREKMQTRLEACRREQWLATGAPLRTCTKAAGSLRFSADTATALAYAEQIALQIGIRRVASIGELDRLGIHVAQAFGGRSGWSCSFGSGKAETPEGAKIGSIMEEAEIYAQDAFVVPDAIRAAFSKARDTGPLPFVDPSDLDLPYDSRFSPDLEIGWTTCLDLAAARMVMVPSAAVSAKRQPNDIYYSRRLAMKQFSSSGLGAGFSLTEAAVHAACECIERHALRMAELHIDNPGQLGHDKFWFVDIETLPNAPRRLVDRYKQAGMSVRILDITSEIGVPSFAVKLFDDPFYCDAPMSHDGCASHPNAEVAITMALLEAGQTKIGAIAGAREDYALTARSLGRHERPRTALSSSQIFWFGSDPPLRGFSCNVGFVTNNFLDELEWIVERVVQAGLTHVLLIDYTTEAIRPANVVRVIIPGVESANPLFTGARARLSSIRDLLPHPTAEDTVIDRRLLQ